MNVIYVLVLNFEDCQVSNWNMSVTAIQ